MPMRFIPFFVRFLAVVLLAVWFGGFTFYGGVVVDALHVDLDRLAAGQITRRVTDRLNLIGVVTLAIWWVLVTLERHAGTRRLRAGRIVLLALDSALLAGLFVMHGIMDRRLDEGGLATFHPLHRRYLLLSTGQ